MISGVLCYIAIAVIAVAVFVVCWLWYMGMFSKIKVEVREIKEMTILNMNYTGAMQDCVKGCADYERRVKELLHDVPIIPRMGSAYYTAPSEIQKPEDNHWSVFFILDDNPEFLERVKQLPASDEYSVTTLPAMKAMYATFPHRSNLSFMFGPMKVYPAMTKFMNDNKIVPCGCFEIYHNNHDPIEYIMQVDQKEAFDKLKETKFVAANKL